jgi:hypothetical protein
MPQRHLTWWKILSIFPGVILNIFRGNGIVAQLLPHQGPGPTHVWGLFALVSITLLLSTTLPTLVFHFFLAMNMVLPLIALVTRTGTETYLYLTLPGIIWLSSALYQL